MSRALYNEFDPQKAAWLRELIREGLIAPGDVDERSITEVQPDDLNGYTQVHFFAGIGGWSHALRLAGWPDERKAVTASCPCPPFSAAGKKKACPGCGAVRPVPCPRRTGYFICSECEHAWFADERHLWPELWRILSGLKLRNRPAPIVFGEQVASNDGLIWLAGVRAGLEMCGYAVGAVDSPAAGVSAPHKRQRIFWLADAERGTTERHGYEVAGAEAGMPGSPRKQRIRVDVGNGCAVGGIPDAEYGRQAEQEPRTESRAQGRGVVRGMVQPGGAGLQGLAGDGDGRSEPGRLAAQSDGSTPATGFAGWRDAYWHYCQDGKYRRTPLEPALFPLADGIPGRVVLLRGAGDAIVPEVAAAFIKTYSDVI